MKKTLVFPLWVGIMAFGVIAQAQEPELSFNISLNKTSFTKGEEIVCTVALKNISSKDQVVNKRLLLNQPMGPHEVWLVIIGPDQKQVPFLKKIDADFKTDDYAVLKPGASATSVSHFKGRFPCDAPGEYSVRGYYENKYDAPAAMRMATAWKGQLVSPVVNFSIH